MIVDNPRILNAVVNLASAGRLRPLVSRVLPLDRAAEAHRILEGRREQPRPAGAGHAALRVLTGRLRAAAGVAAPEPEFLTR